MIFVARKLFTTDILSKIFHVASKCDTHISKDTAVSLYIQYTCIAPYFIMYICYATCNDVLLKAFLVVSLHVPLWWRVRIISNR